MEKRREAGITVRRRAAAAIMDISAYGGRRAVKLGGEMSVPFGEGAAACPNGAASWRPAAVRGAGCWAAGPKKAARGQRRGAPLKGVEKESRTASGGGCTADGSGERSAADLDRTSLPSWSCTSDIDLLGP